MRFLDQTNLLTRDDTFFGVCQGLGEDLGINPNWFRVALALALFVSPLGAVAAYAAGGVLVLASRLLVPHRRSASAEAQPVAARTVQNAQPEALAVAA